MPTTYPGTGMGQINNPYTSGQQPFPFTTSIPNLISPFMMGSAQGGGQLDPNQAMSTAGNNASWLSQMLQQYAQQGSSAMQQNYTNQQQALQSLIGGQLSSQGLLNSLTINPLQTLQTNPMLPQSGMSQYDPNIVNFLQSIGVGGPLTVPNTVNMGQFNQITDPAIQGNFQSMVNATGQPYSSWLSRQQLINPTAGGWKFGMGLQ